MLCSKVVVFIIMSVANLCNIEQPLTEVGRPWHGGYLHKCSLHECQPITYLEDNVVMNSMDNYESVEWTDFDDSFPALEPLHEDQYWKSMVRICNAAEFQDDASATKKQIQSLYLPSDDEYSKDVLKQPSQSNGVLVILEPCQPLDLVARENDHTAPAPVGNTFLMFPVRSTFWILMFVQNVVGLLLTSRIVWNHLTSLYAQSREERTVQMLEGHMFNSFPSEKFRDDSCVIVNLSPTNSQETVTLSDDQENELASFDVLND